MNIRNYFMDKAPLYQKTIRIVFSLIILFAVGVVPAHAKRAHKEDWYVHKYCKGEVPVPVDGTNYRMDCVVNGTSYEFDFVDKRDEAYGQTKRYQYYYKHKYRMGIVLIVEREKDLWKAIEFMKIIRYNREPITIRIIYAYPLANTKKGDLIYAF